jgi:hypothetical protein
MLGVFTIVSPAAQLGWLAGRTLGLAGLCFPAVMTLAMSGATPDDAGLASGLINTTGQVGGALGLAVLVTVSATRSSALLAGGASSPAALTGGYHLAFWIAAGLVAVAILIAVVVLRQPENPGWPVPAPERQQELAAVELCEVC